jgi:glucose-6-phosphate 1-epimerase
MQAMRVPITRQLTRKKDSKNPMTHRYAHLEVPGIATIVSGEGDMPKIRITTAEATAEIYLHGAQVTAWRPSHSDEVLFLSKESGFGAGKAIRGGIPVCFPWFGPKADDPKAPKHGTVRLKEWHLDRIAHEGGVVRISLSTENDAESERWWPHPFRVEHHITVGRELTLDLIAHNTGAQPCTISEAQHTYYHVGSIHEVQVGGLDGVPYLDNTADNQEFLQHGSVTFSKATDNAYQNTETPVTLIDPALKRRIHVEKAGSASTIVWNPWQQGAAGMGDLGNDEWPHFLCIEAANMRGSSVEIAPSQSHTMQTRIVVEQQ